MATATCHTAGCVNAEIPIDVGEQRADPDTGELLVWYVVCGACSQPISDVQ